MLLIYQGCSARMIQKYWLFLQGPSYMQSFPGGKAHQNCNCKIFHFSRTRRQDFHREVPSQLLLSATRFTSASYVAEFFQEIFWTVLNWTRGTENV